MPYVETSIFIDDKPENVYKAASDMESYPKYMADVESVKVIERTENTTLSEWVSDIEGTPIYWTERDTFDREAMTISYKLTEGDLDKFEGTWVCTPSGSGTNVVLGVDFDFGIPHLEELIGPVLKTKVRDNSDMMLAGLKALCEQK
ncbi:MAG: SRPBCC family protein [bacterium]|nr:SRPBCC family protein [bacterium]